MLPHSRETRLCVFVVFCFVCFRSRPHPLRHRGERVKRGRVLPEILTLLRHTTFCSVVGSYCYISRWLSPPSPGRFTAGKQPRNPRVGSIFLVIVLRYVKCLRTPLTFLKANRGKKLGGGGKFTLPLQDICWSVLLKCLLNYKVPECTSNKILYYGSEIKIITNTHNVIVLVKL